ncbi:hypothetical protein ONZ45_g11082 [Pleurotus djamor]|nr:hypothetical protein ONZ45_g11082 [Pleurotus djamor]
MWQPRFPLEIFFLIVKNVEAADKKLLLSLILVSRAFYFVTLPRLYEIAKFNRGHTPDTRLFQGFCQAVAKNNGKLGLYVRVLSFNFLYTHDEALRRFVDMIPAVLPFLTCLAHFELHHPKCRVPPVGFLSPLTSSQLTTFIWAVDVSVELVEAKEDLAPFLATHPLIEHLEVPYFWFTSPPPPNILPNLRKLVIQDDGFLAHDLLRSVSHLTLASLSADDYITDGTEFAKAYSAVKYFSALDGFSPAEVVEFCRCLPNVRAVTVMTPEMEFILSEYVEQLDDDHKFLSKSLEYLLVCSDDNDVEDVEGIFDAIQTLRVIDVIDRTLDNDVFTRYHIDCLPTTLPLDKLPSRWLTEEELEQILA